jgi:L-ascorbate 6-phosphate lactonase
MKLYRSDEELAEEIRNTRLPDSLAAVWALGQEGILIKAGGRTVLFDPYLSNFIYESAGEPWIRKFAPPIKPEQLPELDFVLCSHHHGDHMDEATLKPLMDRAGTRFVIPKAHTGLASSWGFKAEQLVCMKHGQIFEDGELKIKALAAMHDGFEKDEEGNDLFLGYIIKLGGLTVYHAGDTVGFPELVEWLKEEKIDIAFIPMNGRDFTRTAQGIGGNCGYREAADLAVAAGADLVIPMHFGLFPHNDENPAYFVDYLYTRYPQQKFHLMTAGERFVYMK